MYTGETKSERVSSRLRSKGLYGKENLMKILHVIPGLSPLFGGPSKAVLEMCRALQGRGFEVSVATTDADVQGNISIPLGRPVTMDDVTVWCFPCP